MDEVMCSGCHFEIAHPEMEGCIAFYVPQDES
jgi:hypothetical protein